MDSCTWKDLKAPLRETSDGKIKRLEGNALFLMDQVLFPETTQTVAATSQGGVATITGKLSNKTWTSFHFIVCFETNKECFAPFR